MKSRMHWLDTLRCLAGTSMVVLHATSDPNGQLWPDLTVQERLTPAVIRLFAYTARTELFLFIAFFLIVLSYNRKPKNYCSLVGDHARRLLPPFLFWTVFYAIFGLFKANAFGYFDSYLALLTNPVEWIGFFVLGDVKYHMHFLPTLFCLILLHPLFLCSYRTPILGLMLLPCLAMKWHLDEFVWSEFWNSDALPYMVRSVKIFTYAGYGMAAGALAALWTKMDRSRLIDGLGPILLLGCLLFMIKATGTYKVALAGKYDYADVAVYWADFLMPVILFSICMCLHHKSFSPIFGTLGSFSFGLYLCHPIFLDLLEIGLVNLRLTPTIFVLVKLCVTFLCTCTLIWILSKSRLAWTIGLGPLPLTSTAVSPTKRDA